MLKPALGILILLCAGAIAVGLNWNRGGPDLVSWRTDFAGARREAQKGHKFMLLDFTASWCEPCQVMTDTIWNNRAVANAMKQYVPVSVDADAHPELVLQYKVEGYPAMLVVDANSGKIIREVDGLPPTAEGFVTWLKIK